jgi:hypothetical protein
MTENNKNSMCEFGEELVSYLYDELQNAEKMRFEKHLKNCADCADELNEFSFARSSVNEWREVEFTPLATPKIEIPYLPVKVVNVAEKEVSRSWLTAFRELFTLSPAWMTAATAAAALVICVGLFAVLFSNSRINDDMVQTNVKINPSPTTETKEKKAEVSETIPPVNSSEKLPKPAENISNPKVVKTVDPVRVSTINSKPAKPQNLMTVKSSTPKTEPKQNKITPKNINKKAPGLIDNDEEEDDSLRLSDILEEVSMK